MNDSFIESYVCLGIRILIITQVLFLIVNMSPLVLTENSLSFYNIKNQYVITPLGSSNYLATYFGVGFVYEIFQRRRSWLLYSVVSLFGLGLTLSRGGILATTVVVFASYYLINRPTNNHRILRYVSLSIVFVGTSLILIYFDLIQNLTPKIGGLDTGYARLELWIDTYIKIQKYPLLGTGLNYENNPHNALLLSLRSFGVIGFIMVFLFISNAVKYAAVSIKKYSSIRGPAAGILVLFAHSLIEPGIFSVTSQILLATLLSVITSRINTNKYPKCIQPHKC